MSLPDDFAATAFELVAALGSEATYTSVAQGEYDPATGVSIVETTQTVKAVLLDLTLQSNGLSLKYGTEILAGDKEAYVIPPQRHGGSPISVTPMADKLTMAGVEYTVVTFKEVNPTGADPYVYFIYLRR